MWGVSDAATKPPVTERGDIDAVAALLTRMIAEGQGEAAVAIVVRLLTSLRAEVDALQHKLQAALRMLYGRRSEKLTEAERAELAALLGDAAKPDGAAPSPLVGGEAKPAKKALPKGTAHGRGGKPKGLPEERTPARRDGGG